MRELCVSRTNHNHQLGRYLTRLGLGFYHFMHFHHIPSRYNFSHMVYRTGLLLHSRLTARATSSGFRRAFSSSSAVQSCCSGKKSALKNPDSIADSNGPTIRASQPIHSAWKMGVWTNRPAWKRAGLNTLRCLMGCTVGDFSALWMLQSYCPELGMGNIMMASSEFIPWPIKR